jgi:hypothetical protein
MIRNSKLINSIETEVVHSKSKIAYNVIGTKLGCKYKIARIPYLKIDYSNILSEKLHDEALTIATFISDCFNNSELILENFNLKNKLINVIDSILNRQTQLMTYMDDYKSKNEEREFMNCKIKYDQLEFFRNRLIELINE